MRGDLPSGFPEGPMRGYIDHVTPTNVSGWVYDSASPHLQIRVTLDDKVLVEGVADQPRPDVGKALGTGGEHGFRFGSLSLSPKEVDRVVDPGPSGPRARLETGQARALAGGWDSTRASTTPRAGRSHREAEGAGAAAVEEPPQRGRAAPGPLGARHRLQRGLLLRRGAEAGRPTRRRHRHEQRLPRAGAQALPGSRVPPRLLVGPPRREVRRDLLPLGDPLRAAPARAAREARPATSPRPARSCSNAGRSPG